MTTDNFKFLSINERKKLNPEVTTRMYLMLFSRSQPQLKKQSPKFYQNRKV